jgi:hypothetical protein
MIGVNYWGWLRTFFMAARRVIRRTATVVNDCAAVARFDLCAVFDVWIFDNRRDTAIHRRATDDRRWAAHLNVICHRLALSPIHVSVKTSGYRGVKHQENNHRHNEGETTYSPKIFPSHRGHPHF